MGLIASAFKFFLPLCGHQLIKEFHDSDAGIENSWFNCEAL